MGITVASAVPHPALCIPDLGPRKREAAIHSMIARAHQTGAVRDVASVLDAVLMREKLSAGVAAKGVAIPHARALAVQRARARLTAARERRWLTVYERAHARYGRGLAAVRGRVCQGCFITLPTSALPGPESPTVCESCGRVLCWR